MKKFLIVYGSKYHQSANIAQALAGNLKELGFFAECWDAAKISDSIPLKDFDAVIVGGGVYISGYTAALRRWVKKNAALISQKPSAFFSVCLGILQKDPRVQEDERKIVQRFFIKTGWTPTCHTIFAGALPYSQYNWFLKWMMHSMAKKAGFETDTHRDYEYTDWNEVKKFAREFADRVS